MTTRRELIAGLSLAPLALSSRAFAAAEQADAKPQFLFVQTSAGMRYADGMLTLSDVSPIVVLFSDRPERLAGHMATNDFVPFWSEGEDSFKSDPPQRGSRAPRTGPGRTCCRHPARAAARRARSELPGRRPGGSTSGERRSLFPLHRHYWQTADTRLFRRETSAYVAPSRPLIGLCTNSRTRRV